MAMPVITVRHNATTVNLSILSFIIVFGFLLHATLRLGSLGLSKIEFEFLCGGLPSFQRVKERKQRKRKER